MELLIVMGWPSGGVILAASIDPKPILAFVVIHAIAGNFNDAK